MDLDVVKERIKQSIIKTIDKDYYTLPEAVIRQKIEGLFRNVVRTDKAIPVLSRAQLQDILSQIVSDLVGLGPIEELTRDGTITEITETDKGIYCVIRMSPFDVHMTRSPISGKTISIHFKKGAHWPAYFPNYAVRNQRNTIKITNKEEEIEAVVTQVSGIFARRTIAYIDEGEEVVQGDVIGTIRFGSITSVEIASTKNYKLVDPLPRITRAGITILAVQENDSD